MPGNTFGHIFRITTAGESHGPAYVVIIDGLPAGLELSESDLQQDLDRRRPGQSAITTQRQERDEARILSGVFEGRTTGAPVAILIANQDTRPSDYEDIKDKYRPGHADFTFDARYGCRDWRGGGRASARETVVRVAAGAVAKKLLAKLWGVRIVGYVKQIGDIMAQVPDPSAVTLEQVEANIVRCPDPARAQEMTALIEKVRSERDSIGGVAEIVATGVPAGWGEPVFDKLKADIGKAMFSIPAVMGVEYGAGFSVVSMRGSQCNDLFQSQVIDGQCRISTQTNRHGGMLGGISTGMPLIVRCAVKPTSSIPTEQPTVTRDGQPTTILTHGRHDPCLLPRFVPVAEAMLAIVLADQALHSRCARL